MIRSIKTLTAIIFAFLFLSILSHAQNLSNIELNYKKGYILSHTPEVDALVLDQFNTYDFNLNFNFDSTSQVYHTFNNPTWGINLIYTNWSAPEFFGNVFACSSHMNFPLIRKKSFLFLFKLGAGLGYVSKPFNTDNNYHNIAIGSEINAYINIDFFGTHRINKFLALNYGVNLYHLSNAAFTMPNLGINALNYKLGFSYYLNDDFWASNASLEKVSVDYKYEIRSGFSVGMKENYPVLGQKFTALNWNTTGAKRISKKSSLTFGMDYFYDPSKIALLESRDNITLGNKFQISQLAFNLGYQLHLNQVATYIQMGTYAISKYKRMGLIYHRIGVAYYTKKPVVLTLALKSHWAKADNVELGINYYWRK